MAWEECQLAAVLVGRETWEGKQLGSIILFVFNEIKFLYLYVYIYIYAHTHVLIHVYVHLDVH
jgi:hypothetical protein